MPSPALNPWFGVMDVFFFPADKKIVVKFEPTVAYIQV